MSTDDQPSKKDCEELVASLGKPKASLKDKIPLGASGRRSKDVKQDDESNKKKYTLKDRINDIKTGFAEISKNMKDKQAQKKTVGAVDSSKAGGSEKQIMSTRRMIYPYTLSAKIAHFPYRYYFDNCWYFRYTVFAVVASLPLFMYFGAKSHSPGNVAEWKEKRREMFTPHH